MISAALGWLVTKVPGWMWVALASVGLLFASKLYIDHLRSQVKASKAETAQVKADWKAEHIAMQKAIDAEKARQAEVVTKTVTVYRDRVKVVHDKGEDVIHEVEKLIPADCVLPGAFRLLHDAAAGAIALPDDPARAAATADAVDCATAAETVARNYESALLDQARLVSLQELVKSLRKP